MEAAGVAGTVGASERRSRGDRIAGAIVLGLVGSIAASGALFLTELAGGASRWWWITAAVVVVPSGLAVLVAPRRRRAVVGLIVLVVTVSIGVVLEQRAPIPEDRVIHQFDDLTLPSGYTFVDEPYVGDDALGVGGYFVSAHFEHPADSPGDAADELCADLRRQGWKMQCRYDALSSDNANQEFLGGDAEYADLWGSNGRFRVAVELGVDTDLGVVIVKTDQPPLNPFVFFGE